MRYVVYERVSTDRQGKSGLGLEAQERAVASYISQRDGERVATFVETESGKSHRNRPELAKARELCLKTGATLLIAKLDRLARNVHFISGLMEDGLNFVAADMPNADKFMIHIYAAMAERERELISERTKAAFVSAQKRNGYWPGKEGRQKSADKADQRARELEPYIVELRAAGVTTLRGIADGLSKRLGKNFHATQIQRIQDRLAA